MKKDDFQSLLGTLVRHWRESGQAYAEYMSNGKKFRYAELLRLHNTAAKNLLADNIAVIPQAFKKDAEAIIEHYTIWSAKWDDLKSSLNPGPDDEFAFANDHRFPKDAAQRMEAAFRALSEGLQSEI